MKRSIGDGDMPTCFFPIASLSSQAQKVGIVVVMMVVVMVAAVVWWDPLVHIFIHYLVYVHDIVVVAVV